jgi:hypothetical protein
MLFRRSRWSLAILFLAAASISLEAQTRAPAKTSKNPTQPAVTAQPATTAQPAVWESWDTLKPENEDFSILMPKDTSTEITKFDYHKMELNVRFYLSAPATGPVVAVASMSGIKSNPAAYSDFERFNSYADAFKQFFPAKVRKDAVTKMILTSTKPFHGYTGRVYKLTVGDLNGMVNAYVTRKRFYAIAILNTKKDEALEDKFLGSFVIPDKPAEQTRTAVAETVQEPNAVTEPENNEQSGRPARKPRVEIEGAANTSGAPATTTVNPQPDNVDAGTAQPGSQPNADSSKRAPISGGMLNGKAIYLPMPEMPPGEKAGVVMVQVLVDEQGSVISARAVSGPPNLLAAAVNAARLARFLPTVLSGEPVKVNGTLAYNFVHSN